MDELNEGGGIWKGWGKADGGLIIGRGVYKMGRKGGGRLKGKYERGREGEALKIEGIIFQPFTLLYYSYFDAHMGYLL